jgi:hypothetical protein
MPIATVALATAARVLAAALETASYCGWWASWGRRLPFARAFLWTLAFASLDLVSAHLVLVASDHGPPFADILAVLAGPNAAREGVAPGTRGLWLAFGGFGLLTAARIVGTSYAHASLTGARLAAALGTVAGFWLATRLTLWWGVDLLGGRSSLP